MYLFCVQGSAHAMVHMWRSKNTFRALVLSFLHVAHRDTIQAFRLSGKHLYC